MLLIELKNYANDWSMSGLNAGIYIYHISYSDTEHRHCTETGKLVIVN